MADLESYLELVDEERLSRPAEAMLVDEIMRLRAILDPAKNEILGAATWPTNGHLIRDVARLHLDQSARTLDTTYGEGNWWTIWKPDQLVMHDLYKGDGVDFRDLPHGDCEFRQVAFDPPYVCVGGRETSTMPEYLERYGMHNAPPTPKALQQMMNDGIAEVRRVTEPGGVVLWKCADYVWSGNLWLGVHECELMARQLGFRIEDKFVHVGDVRPQPPGRGQKHARQNSSVLLVLVADGRQRQGLF